MICKPDIKLLLLPACIAGLTLLASCSHNDIQQPAAIDQPQLAAPTPDELSNATYLGIMDKPITLTDGEWQGPPFVAGGAARPRVGLVKELLIAGDLDSDGNNETVVLLWSSSAGSGTFDYLAVVARAPDGGVSNTATTALGDRVAVRAAAIAKGVLTVEAVVAGPDDAACCPGTKVRNRYQLRDAKLLLIDSEDQGRLSFADLGGTTWLLESFSRDARVPAGIDVTLTTADTGIAGSSGCNRYSGTVTPGDRPGDRPGSFTLDPAMLSTLMACPPAAEDVEQRYLQQLQGATGFAFSAGRLLISWQVEQEDHKLSGTMIYVRADTPAE